MMMMMAYEEVYYPTVRAEQGTRNEGGILFTLSVMLGDLHIR